MSLYIPIISTAIPQLEAQGVDPLAIRRVLIRVAQKYTPILQKASPVDTGRLRRSLRVELLSDDQGVAMSSPVFYAGFVEFGTRKMRPRSYASSLAPEIIQYMNSLLAQLGSFQSSRVTKINPGERTGMVSQFVSQGFLDRVRSLRVSSQFIAPINVPPATLDQLAIQDQQVI